MRGRKSALLVALATAVLTLVSVGVAGAARDEGSAAAT